MVIVNFKCIYFFHKSNGSFANPGIRLHTTHEQYSALSYPG